MGILKNALMDALEGGDYFAEWECPNCSEENESEFEIPDINLFSDRARDMAASNLWEIVCEKCATSFEGMVHNHIGGIEFDVKDGGGNTIELTVCEPDELRYEDWFEFETPDDPFTIFMNSYHHTGDIIADYEGHHSSEIINRMVFVHQITALETYLGDTLINCINNDDAALARLLEKDGKLKKQKYSLLEIIGKREFVQKEANTYLRNVLFHNLKRVNFLYRTVVNIEIFEDQVDRSVLYKAIEYRHDCVHRNGMDDKGEPLAIFTNEYVQSIADQVKAMVEHIEKNK